MGRLIVLVAITAIVIALMIGAAGPVSRIGLWDYGFGLVLIRKLALPAMIAGGLSAAGFLAALFVARGVAPAALLGAVCAAVAASVPLQMRSAFNDNPFIHDITTDFEEPPQIITAADFERKNPPEYLGNEEKEPREGTLTVAQAQRDAFPDITPIVSSLEVDAAAAVSRGVIAAMGLKILDESPIEGGSFRIEAAHTSFWFGFVDDFVVRIRPVQSVSGEAAGSVVDIRSKSRIGGSDLGANAERVRDFTRRFQSKAGAD